MTNKKLKKRSLSESNQIDQAASTDVNGTTVASKKKKVEKAQGAQSNNLPAGKTNQLSKQTEKDVNKKKQNKQALEKNDEQVSVNKGAQKTQLGKAKKRQHSPKKVKKEQDIEETIESKTKNAPKQKSMEEITNRINEIESRETISKTAKRKLASFKRMLRVMQNPDSVRRNSAEKQDNENNKGKKRSVEDLETIKNDKKLKQETNSVIGKKQVQNNKAIKKVENENTTEASAVQSTKNKQNRQQNKPGSLLRIKQEKDEEEELEDEEEEEESDEEENDEQVDMEDSDDDEDEDNEESKKKIINTKNEQTVDKKKGLENERADQNKKKKRYVLFVGNLPVDATIEQIKKHFLAKVSAIVSVRMPKEQDTNKPQKYCYVEVGNPTDFEKGLSLNNSFLAGKKIRVELSTGNKKELIGKKKKLEALRKSGKLAGSEKQVKQRAKKENRKTVTTT